MATLWLATTIERNRRVFYASIDNISFYKLRKHEEDPYVIHYNLSEEPTGKRRWRSRRRLEQESGTHFSDPVKL